MSVFLSYMAVAAIVYMAILYVKKDVPKGDRVLVSLAWLPLLIIAAFLVMSEHFDLFESKDWEEALDEINKSDEYEERIDKLRSAEAIARAPGNFNYDPGQHGYANGIIFARATMEGVEPTFLNAPEKWLDEKHNLKPVHIDQQA